MNWDLLLNSAYVPYSKSPDACIVKGSKGGFFPGVRIENVSFPLTISSVQAACCICLSMGEKPVEIYVSSTKEPQIEFWKTEFDCEISDEFPSIDAFNNYHLESPIEKRSVLQKLLPSAITPNSDFPVSAIIFSDKGIYSGVNIEVSDWSKGLCAERVALAKALASGVKKFENISVHTLKGQFSSPCGACRQVLYEHMPLSKSELFHADGTYSEHFIVDLLPFSFTSKDLGA